MAKEIRITAGAVVVNAQLNDSSTATAILMALPIRGNVRTWGDEIYFPIPVDHTLAADAVQIVELGALGYWPTGKAFCIFFGLTPMSLEGEIRPASAVNVVGRVLGDTSVLKNVTEGEPVIIEIA
jgi:uncharacterized protein